MFTLITIVALGFAQEEDRTRVIQYKPVTEIEFSRAEINALPDRPSMGFVVEPPARTHNPMIELRTDFNVEIEESLRTL